MSILILSTPSDLHAVAVEWGLIQLGVDVLLWNWEDFPNRDIGQWSISSQDSMTLNWQISESVIQPKFKAIWYRRPAKSKASQYCHPDDQSVIQNESDEFLDNCLHFLGDENVVWFNHPAAARNADNKLLQLVVAKEMGFIIPSTLVGNSVAVLEEFFEKHSGRVICKGFSPKIWNNSDGTKTLMRTSLLNREHLTNAHTIFACPSIYQELIEKDYELRVTVMGETVFAVMIESQKEEVTIDWRSDIKDYKLPLKSVKLPQKIEDQCRRLCNKLNLSFGAIDMIVTKSGEHVFLEVNESGQFLWIEKSNANLLMLDAFCKALATASGESYSIEKELALKDWYESASYSEFLSRTTRF